MKKSNFLSKMSFLLVLMLIAALALGCGKKTDTTTTTTPEETLTQEASSEASSEEATIVEESSSEEPSVAEESLEDSSSQDISEETTYEKIGEGSTTFVFEMTLEQETTGYEVSTDEQTVGAALLALDLVAGDVSEYGLFVTSVMGNEPVSDAAGTPYWAFYIDGAYAPTGVDATEITAGSTYSFVVETY